MPDHPHDQTPAAPADPPPMPPALALALEASFGSVAHWQRGFMALARDVGDVVLSFRPADARLVNQLASAHGTGPDGWVRLLALPGAALVGQSVGSDPPAGGTACMAHIDWSEVHARYQAAVNAASEVLATGPGDLAGALVLDVRRAGAYALADTVLPGARWADPAGVDQWAADLPTDRAVVVYCVHGHEVSRATALRLRATGIRAGFLQGGIGAWAASGRPLAAKSAADGIDAPTKP